MTIVIVFCTAAAADRKVLDRFNQKCGRGPLRTIPGLPPVPDKFISALERKITKDDTYSREEPHLFDGWPDDRCAKYYEEQFESERFIDKAMFVTMDERSAKDDTVVFHHRTWPDKTWESWRIQFEDAFFTLVSLTENLDEYDFTFKQSGRFLGEDGVFHPQEAAKETERERQKKYRSAGVM